MRKWHALTIGVQRVHVVLLVLLVLVGCAMVVLLDVIGIEQLVPVKPSSHSHLPPPRHRPFPEHVFIGLHPSSHSFP